MLLEENDPGPSCGLSTFVGLDNDSILLLSSQRIAEVLGDKIDTDIICPWSPTYEANTQTIRPDPFWEMHPKGGGMKNQRVVELTVEGK